MEVPQFFDSAIFTWIILPILIFLARITDVSIGTLRLIFVAKGFKKFAPFLGFFEVIIWLLAVGQIIKHLDNFVCYIAYGAGFATGNFVGMYLEEKLSIGNVVIRVIIKYESDELIKKLRQSNYGITVIDGQGSQGKVKVLLSIIKRENIKDFVSIINQINPNSFYTIEEVKSVKEGIFKKSEKKKYRFF